jgi:hypothetical protein
LETKGPYKKDISSRIVSKYEKIEVYHDTDISARQKASLLSVTVAYNRALNVTTDAG